MRRDERPDGVPLTDEQLGALDAHWRSATYLPAGQIYPMDNLLLRKPLEPVHIKPRLPGHRGASPGLNPVRTHLRERGTTTPPSTWSYATTSTATAS